MFEIKSFLDGSKLEIYKQQNSMISGKTKFQDFIKIWDLTSERPPKGPLSLKGFANMPKLTLIPIIDSEMYIFYKQLDFSLTKF